jgi:hypothetical protein
VRSRWSARRACAAGLMGIRPPGVHAGDRGHVFRMSGDPPGRPRPHRRAEKIAAKNGALKISMRSAQHPHSSHIHLAFGCGGGMTTMSQQLATSIMGCDDMAPFPHLTRGGKKMHEDCRNSPVRAVKYHTKIVDLVIRNRDAGGCRQGFTLTLPRPERISRKLNSQPGERWESVDSSCTPRSIY